MEQKRGVESGVKVLDQKHEMSKRETRTGTVAVAVAVTVTVTRRVTHTLENSASSFFSPLQWWGSSPGGARSILTSLPEGFSGCGCSCSCGSGSGSGCDDVCTPSPAAADGVCS
jgi:hypothetical protein